VRQRHAHSNGPMSKRDSQIDDQVSCRAQTAATIAQRAGRLISPINNRERHCTGGYDDCITPRAGPARQETRLEQRKTDHHHAQSERDTPTYHLKAH
jgi:hypothetical protein